MDKRIPDRRRGVYERLAVAFSNPPNTHTHISFIDFQYRQVFSLGDPIQKITGVAKIARA